MAKNRVNIDVKVDDKGTTKKVGLAAKNAGKGLDGAAKSSDNYSRKQKGVAGATSNSTKAFSKMQQGTGGLVGAYASLAAQLFAVSAAFSFLKSAGQLESLKSGQMAYSASTGTAMRTLTNDIIAATEAQISFTDAAQAAAIGISSGLAPEQLTRLGKAAKDASLILGRDVTDSFNRLVRGVTKAEPELLDELGIILRLKKATEDYGKVINKSADELTAFERTQAVTNEVLGQSEEKYSRILEVTGATVNKFEQLGKAFDKIVNQIKTGAAALATPLADVLLAAPYMVFGAIGLLMKPVLTAILPGLGNVVASTAAVATAAKTSFSQATIAAEAYNKSLKKLKPIDTSAAKAGMAGILSGKDTSKNSSLSTLKNSKDLSNKKIAILRKEITKKKLLQGKERTQFLQHLRIMEQSQTVSNKRMAMDYNAAQNAKTLSLSRFAVNAKGLYAGIAVAGAAAARFISVAFSALGWIGLIATLAMTAYQFFKTKDSAEETADSFDYMGDKITGVNEELEHFNKIQNILNEDGQATIATLGNMGRAMANISSQAFGGEAEKIDSILKKRKGSTKLLVDMVNRQGELRRKLDGYNSPGSDNAYTGMTVNQRNAAMGRDQDELNELNNYTPTLLATVKTTPGETLRKEMPELLKLMERETAFITENADAKIKNSTAGKAYVTALARVKVGTAETTDELIRSREEYKNYSLQVGELTKIQEENADVAQAIRKKLFPETQYDKYLRQLENEKVLREKASKDSPEMAAFQEAKIKLLDTEISLMTRLNDQIHRQKLEVESLKLAQATEKRGNMFKFQGTEQKEKYDILTGETELRHMKEKLATDREAAVGQGAEAQKGIALTEIAIAQQEQKLALIKEQSTDMYKLTSTLSTSLESGLGTAFSSIIQGTESVKQAFAGMAIAILKSLASVLAEMMAVYVIKQLISGFSFGASNAAGGYGESLGGADPFSTASFRNGGIASEGQKVQGYSTGGVAKGSTSGYPAVLHGTEAVVPLPNGKSIPVDMGNAGSVSNNIVVNVAADGKTSTSNSSGMDMDKLGKAVAAAVQAELHNQKRSGGILNPYGVA